MKGGAVFTKSNFYVSCFFMRLQRRAYFKL